MNVLIIDDESSLRRTLRTALESMGHHVNEAQDGDRALESLSHHSFDLAFLDLRLGQEQGLELLKERKECAARSERAAFGASRLPRVCPKRRR